MKHEKYAISVTEINKFNLCYPDYVTDLQISQLLYNKLLHVNSNMCCSKRTARKEGIRTI